MKIGIYNHWLSTLGGGEKVTAAMAEALSRHYQVDLIAPEPIAKIVLEERINADLDKVDVKVINLENQKTSNYTQHYDLFINTTHSSILPTQCKRNLMYVHFPLKLIGGFLLKKKLKAFLFRRFRYAHPLEGLYPAERYEDFVYRWTGAYANLRIPLPRQAHQSCLELSVRGHHANGASSAKLRLKIGREELSELLPLSPSDDFQTLRVHIPDHRSQHHFLDAEIFANTFQPALEENSPDKRELGLMIGWMRSTNGPEPLHWLLTKIFPSFDMRLQNQFELLVSQLHLDRYQTICSNSRYTQKWVKRYWNRDSSLLYPPIDVFNLRPREKQNIILSVGRFFDGHHNKKHLEMITAFKEMCDEGLKGWKLVLVGGTHKEHIHQAYLHRLIQASEGYPISILTNIPFAELKELYGISKLYWHATGLHEDESKAPERFEHFGISTVEAMAAGCVPIVIGKAGQTEIITHGRNGLLWKRLEELKRYSLKLISNEASRQDLALSAMARSQHFSRQAFERNLLDTVERALASA